jgi:hypothetical protein
MQQRCQRKSATMNNKWQGLVSEGLLMLEKMLRNFSFPICHGHSVQNLHIILHFLHHPIARLLMICAFNKVLSHSMNAARFLLFYELHCPQERV